MTMIDASVSDHNLILALQRGQRKAFRVLYQRYSPALYRSLLRMVRLEDVAEELLQVVFVRCWENRHRLDADKSFRGYLYKIAENCVYDYFRKLSREAKILEHLSMQEEPTAVCAEYRLLEKERQAALDAAVARLPPRRR